MTDEEYQKTQDEIITIATKIEKLDLTSFLGCISKADTLGPILDPTTYRDAYENLRGIEKMAQLLVSIKEYVPEFRQTVFGTLIREVEKDGFIYTSAHTGRWSGNAKSAQAMRKDKDESDS